MKQKIVCVSYIPTSKRLDMHQMINMSGNDISDKFGKLEPELPSNCVIIKTEKSLSPVFIMNHSNEIWDNSMAWCENDPEKWFYFGVKSRNNETILALFPNLEESIKRFKLNQQIVPIEDNINIIYHPIGIKLVLDTTNIENQFNKKVNIGFSEDIESIRSGKINWLNNVPRSDDVKYVNKYLVDSLQRTTAQEGCLH